MRTIKTITLISCTVITVSANAQRLGAGGTMIDGNQVLPMCDKPIGTVALVEEKRPAPAQDQISPQLAALMALARQRSGVADVDPIPLLKILAAQSHCFQVVDRGEGFNALQRERAIADGGQLAPGARVNAPTLTAANYMLTAQIIYQDANAGGSGAGLGGLGGGFGGLGGIATKRLESQTMLTLVNVRTGVQQAIATGSARKKDIKIGGAGLVGLGIGAIGGYQSTDIGKITAAALLDAFRKLVPQVQAIAPQAQATTTPPSSGTQR